MATTPEDDDVRLDQTLREVLQPTLSDEADRRIRARLNDVPAPATPPPWLLQPQAAPTRETSPWRFALLGAAAVLMVACGLVVYLRTVAVKPSGRNTQPEVTRETPPPSTTRKPLEPQNNVVEQRDPAREGPAVLGDDYKSPLLNPVKPPEAPKK